MFVVFLRHVVSGITALQLKLIKRDEHITGKFAFANVPVEIRSNNCFGMSSRGTMTQDRFLVSPLFLSISVDVDPFIKKCWFAVVLQSLLFRSCRQIHDSFVC